MKSISASFGRASLVAAPLALVLSGALQASDLDLAVESGGATTVQVFPGDVVNFAVRGELTDNDNQGLAMFAFDLAFDGGPLTQLTAGPNMGPFVAPAGINNPAGFGGTVDGLSLLQVGGAQNTINNTFAPQPIGMVQTGLCGLGSPETLATGSLVAPPLPGTYTISVSNLFANAIDPLTIGNPFWAVDPVGAGTLTGLTIEVLDCAPQIECGGQQNSVGCTPQMAMSGYASFTDQSTLTLDATLLVNEEFGLWLWSTDPGPVIRFGSTLCIGGVASSQLMPTTSGGGGIPRTTCDGSFQFTFDGALLASGGYTPGTTVYTQLIYRDPIQVGPSVIGVTPSVSFVVCP